MTGREGWLLDLFEDLEQRAAAAYADERDAEVADLGREQYRAVSLASRLLASRGRPVVAEVAGAGRLAGDLLRSGPDWCLLGSSERAGEWLVALRHLSVLRGASERSVHDSARPALARLPLTSVLRGLGEGGDQVRLVGADGTTTDGVVVRVGADFVEVATGRDQSLVSLSALSAVRSR